MIWFHKLGFKHNPFTIKPTHAFSFYATQTVIKQIDDSIMQGKIIVIEGSFGVGKTTYLRTIIDLHKGKKKVIYFSCNRLRESLDVNRLLYGRNVLTRALKMKSKGMILLLDEAQNLHSTDFGKLLVEHNKGFFQSILFVTHNKQLLPQTVLKSARIFHFNTPTPRHIIRIVRERIGEQILLPDALILHIYALDKRMRYFLRNCERYMRHVMEKGLSEPLSKKQIVDLLRRKELL